MERRSRKIVAPSHGLSRYAGHPNRLASLLGLSILHDHPEVAGGRPSIPAARLNSSSMGSTVAIAASSWLPLCTSGGRKRRTCDSRLRAVLVTKGTGEPVAETVQCGEPITQWNKGDSSKRLRLPPPGSRRVR
jgi:hypothetical protein